MSALLEPIRKQHDLPALAGSIVGPRGTLATGATGRRARGVDDPVSIDDRWHLGSCTKAMTATLVALLVEEGRISWGTTLGEIFPRETSSRPEWKIVTIEQLLRHRSGLPADGTRWISELPDASREGPMRDRRRSVVREALTQPPESAPDAERRYSNAGYTIAGAMLEERMDETWEDLVRQRLFGPLGMSSAGFGPPAPLPQPQGHRKGLPLGVGEDADLPSVIGPAGTVHASLEDWGRFVSLHLAGATSGSRLLTDESFSRMHSLAPGTEHAIGWTVANGLGRRAIFATGSNHYWYALVWLAPEHELALLVVTNEGGEHARKATNEAARALFRHHKAR